MQALASSVVRLTNKGSAHGYLYLIDFNEKSYKTVLNWSEENINWEGRGGDRGLRGICFYNDLIIVGSGSQILFLDKNFKVVNVFSHDFLGDIHEIIIYKDQLIITSTLFDLILFLDLKTMRLVKGYHIVSQKTRAGKQALFHRKAIAVRKRILYRYFNSNKLTDNFLYELIDVDNYIPTKADNKKSIHINSVFIWNEQLCFTGTQFNKVFKIDLQNDKLSEDGIVPFGTHNVMQLTENQYILNYTIDEKLVICNRKGKIEKKFKVQYETSKSNYKFAHAKPGWVRGLSFNKEKIIVGCSPASVNLFNYNSSNPECIIKLDEDVRNSIHGLEIIPENFF